jgi:hypothetical protein
MRVNFRFYFLSSWGRSVVAVKPSRRSKTNSDNISLVHRERQYLPCCRVGSSAPPLPDSENPELAERVGRAGRLASLIVLLLPVRGLEPSIQRVGHHILGFIQNRFQVRQILKTLCVHLEDVLRAGRTGRKPASSSNDLQTANWGVAACPAHRSVYSKAGQIPPPTRRAAPGQVPGRERRSSLI